MPEEEKWRNRVVAVEEVNPEELTANPMNWRRHPQVQAAAMDAILNEVGWVTQVVVNRRTGNIVDGHLRVERALHRGEPTVPVNYVDMTEEEERLVLATLDPIGDMARADDAAFASLVSDLDVSDEELKALLDVSPPPDPEALWTGMPEFIQNDIGAWRSLTVHFVDEEAWKLFCALVGENITTNNFQHHITEKTRSIWYPKTEVAFRGEAIYEGQR